MSEIFKFAVALAREQAANTAYETSHRRMLESFAADRAKRKNNDVFTFDKATADAEELACCDRAEARAVNSGAW